MTTPSPRGEGLFRTTEYRPEFPINGPANLETARQWAARSVQWHNHEHRHSGTAMSPRRSVMPERIVLYNVS
jgi:hypothetical protein